jgi:hypothetical protein
MLARMDRLDHDPIPTPCAAPGPRRPGLPGELIARHFDRVAGWCLLLCDRTNRRGQATPVTIRGGQVSTWLQASLQP